MRIGEEVEPITTPYPGVKDDMMNMMFVALGKDVKESENVLMWALRNSRGMRICILHVHQPARKIKTMPGGKVSISLMKEHRVKAHHEIERQEMHKNLDKYIQICDQDGVQAEKLCIEMDSVEKGIVQLVSEHGIKYLVMGAAANKSYSRKMKEPKSRKAIHVLKEAPSFCHIWFICKGNLIHTRESKVNTETESPPFQANPLTEGALSLKSLSVAEGMNGQRIFRHPSINNRGARSDIHGMLAPNSEGTSDCDSLSKRSHSLVSTCSSTEVDDSALIPFQIAQGNKIGSELPIFQHNDEDHSRPSIASDAVEQNVNNELYDRRVQSVAEAECSPKEVYDDESVRPKKAEKDVIDVIRKAKASETMHPKQLKLRKELEEALARGKEESEEMKMQLSEIMEDLRVAQEQKFSLKSQISFTDKMVEDLEQKMFSAVELLQKYKKEQDELEVKRDNALRVAEELRVKQTEAASSSSVSQFFRSFPFWKLKRQQTDLTKT